MAVVVVLVSHRAVGGGALGVGVPGRARQVAGGKRAVRRDADAVLAADRNHLALVLTVEQVVVALHAAEAGPAVLVRDDLHVVEPVRVHGAGAQRADLAGFHQAVERLHGLLDRRVVIEAVDDVEVQVVGAKTLERTLDLALDCRARKATLVEVDLAGQHDVLAPDAQVLERLADELLAGAVCVYVGGIEEVDAPLDRLLYDRLRCGLVDHPLVEVGKHLAKAHAADADAADPDARLAEVRVLHGLLSLCPCPVYGRVPAM